MNISMKSPVNLNRSIISQNKSAISDVNGFVNTISDVQVNDQTSSYPEVQETEAGIQRNYHYEFGSKVESAHFDDLYEHGRTNQLKQLIDTQPKEETATEMFTLGRPMTAENNNDNSLVIGQ